VGFYLAADVPGPGTSAVRGSLQRPPQRWQAACSCPYALLGLLAKKDAPSTSLVVGYTGAPGVVGPREEPYKGGLLTPLCWIYAHFRVEPVAVG